MTAPVSSGGKERSPNYPSLGLPEAISYARKIWEREKRTTVPPEVAVRAWGYTSMSGASRGAIAALKQYGLIVSAGDGVVLTDLAVAILVHQEGTAEWSEAVTVAANEPALFRELRESYSNASDDSITAYLITKRRFSVDGSKRCLRSYRETVELANQIERGYTKASGKATIQPSEPLMKNAIPQSQHVDTQQVVPFSIPIDSTFRVELRLIGGPLTPRRVSKLKKHIDLLAEDFGDDKGGEVKQD